MWNGRPNVSLGNNFGISGVANVSNVDLIDCSQPRVQSITGC